MREYEYVLSYSASLDFYRLKEAVSHHSLIIEPPLTMKYALATEKVKDK